MDDQDNTEPSDSDAWIRKALSDFESDLMRYASGLLAGDINRARDLVQECYLRLCKQDRRQVEGHIGEWLFRVCRNGALDIQRKENRMTNLDEEARATPSPASPPESALEQADELELVMGALNSLPPKQQEALRLKFQYGHTYKEIARITEETVGTVGWLIHEGLGALRLRLKVHDQANGAKV